MADEERKPPRTKTIKLELKVDPDKVKWTEDDTTRIKAEMVKLQNLPVRMMTPLVFD